MASSRLFPNRAAEIRQFLLQHPEVKRFAIIDDRPGAADGELLDCFVKTESTVGLTEEHVSRIVQLLRVDRSSEWWAQLRGWGDDKQSSAHS